MLVRCDADKVCLQLQVLVGMVCLLVTCDRMIALLTLLGLVGIAKAYRSVVSIHNDSVIVVAYWD